MVPIRAGRLRLLSAPSTPGGMTPEPILLFSACPAIGDADERVRFCVTFNPDGLFTRDREYAPGNQEPQATKGGWSFRETQLEMLALFRQV